MKQKDIVSPLEALNRLSELSQATEDRNFNILMLKREDNSHNLGLSNESLEAEANVSYLKGDDDG